MLLREQAGCPFDDTGSPRRVRPVADKMPVLRSRPPTAESNGLRDVVTTGS